MIIDTSAVVAVLLKEPGFELVFQKLAAAETIGIGAPSWHRRFDPPPSVPVFIPPSED